jgi:metallo-beta-lactamase family protein
MRISFHGAARTVTGSQYLLEVNGSRLLLECGLYQGRRDESYLRNKVFKFDPASIDTVLLSHAHIDHSGNLPLLVKNGFTGPIHATAATVDLADIMLRDSGHVQEANTESANHRRERKGEPLLEPLYTEEDALKVKPQLKPVPYDQPVEVADNVKVTFHDAGHILGAAAIRLEMREKDRLVKLWFSGDIGRRNLPILRDPVFPFDSDYIIMECTYGDKPHPDPTEAHREFHDVVLNTIRRGGKVIIPAFAVGRTQELVYILHLMYAAGTIPRVPIFVDSPLAVNASRIFGNHPECYDEQTRHFIEIGKHPALNFEELTYVQSAEESKGLNERKGPMVIISASGMAETGRILYHIKNNIEDARNTILIVSWQAPETLGRRLADREKNIRIFGETYYRRAEVATIGGLSAHAGQNTLTEYALTLKNQLKNIFLVHGEADAETALQARLNEAGERKLVYPDLHEAVEL